MTDLSEKNYNNFSFGKDYKLCSRKEIEVLFEKGASIKKYPLRLIYGFKEKQNSTGNNFQVVFSVPKRIQKHAADRNRIKRLLREALRFEKESLENLLQEKETKLNLIIIYLDKEEFPLPIIQKKVRFLFEELKKQIPNENQ